MNKAAAVVKKPEEPAAPTTKICPYCKSEINIEATKCPCCTSDL
jgi:large conductance mechanosensitive channel